MCANQTKLIDSKTETIDRLRQGITEIESRNKPSSRRAKKIQAVDDSIPTRQCKGCLATQELSSFDRDSATGRRSDFCGKCAGRLREMAENRSEPARWERPPTEPLETVTGRLSDRAAKRAFRMSVRKTRTDGELRLDKLKTVGLSFAMYSWLVDSQETRCPGCRRAVGYDLKPDVDTNTRKVHGLACGECHPKIRGIRKKVCDGLEQKVKKDPVSSALLAYVKRRPPVIPLM